MPAGKSLPDERIADNGAIIRNIGRNKLNELMESVIADVGEVQADDIVAAMLNATTIDEVLGAGVVHVEELIPIEDEIEIIKPNLRAQRSTFEGTDYYIVADVKVNGVAETLVTSSQNCIAQLFKMVQLDALPLKVHVIKRTSSRGYDVYRFGVARKRPVKA